MSWFSKYVEHPAMNALAGLMSQPAIAGNPGALAAVADAQKAATTIAATTTAAAAQVAATAQAAADPILSDIGGGLQSIADAYLMSFGPIGALEVPVANAVIAMGEQFFHQQVANLFAHARVAHAAAVATKPAA